MMLLSTARSVSCSMPLKHRSRSLHVGHTQSVVNLECQNGRGKQACTEPGSHYVHEANSDVTRPWPDDYMGALAQSSVKHELWLISQSQSLNANRRNFSWCKVSVGILTTISYFGKL